ncbi:MAG TPA: hypothetical protein PLS67_11970 [Accumulibacter sp.]|nr:hypothetical protein [Accumulibacter sp.]
MFLSFFVISFIGVVLAGFPLLNRIGAWVTKPSKAKAAASKASEKPAAQPPASVPGGDDIPPDDLAVIAAVVAAMIGDHRILHIERQARGAEWSSAGRMAQHHSHTPRDR